MSVHPGQRTEIYMSESVGSLPLRTRAGNFPWLLLLAVVVALFFWKILFTKQFSFLEDWEASNQAYAWHQFAVSTIQKGILPVWDPYTFSGVLTGLAFLGTFVFALVLRGKKAYSEDLFRESA